MQILEKYQLFNADFYYDGIIIKMVFLRKLFIKDYQNVKDPIVRKKHGLLASCVGIFTNVILFAFKLACGILTLSMSIVFDAINNLMDFLSCFISLLGFKLSGRPADKRHPFGHERIEYITGLIISFIIVGVALILAYTSILKLITHQSVPTYGVISLVILGVSILFKVGLGIYYRYMGNIIDSEALKASMVDSFSDALCTTGVLSCALISYFIPDIYWLDPTISLLISLLILYSGIKMVLTTTSPLIGTATDPQLLKNLKNDILQYPIVLGVHDLICHSYGHTKVYAIAHCEVDGHLKLIDAHDQIDEIEHDLSKKYKLELTIHIDPINAKDEKLDEIKTIIMEILSKISLDISIHDLRIHKLHKQKTLSFDVVLPFAVKVDENQIKTDIAQALSLHHINLSLDVKFDHRG